MMISIYLSKILNAYIFRLLCIVGITHLLCLHAAEAQSMRQHSYEEILPGYLIFDFGINGWRGQDTEQVRIQMPSVGFSLAYLGQVKVSEHFELLPGVGFSFENYRFDRLRTIEKAGEQLVFPEIEDIFDISKTKLALDFIEVPIELHYHTPIKGREFRVGLGAKLGYQIGARSKIKYKGAPKVRVRDDFYTQAFRYGIQARVGYGNIALFAYYRLNPLFETERLDCNCAIQSFHIGMTLLAF
ncbi:MAG: PorT family protein [Bernardetiaceae bacterium]|nr:PorT family protein [Bernardetiaceae bacterium]